MFGLTEFNIFHEKKGWVVKLVTGKNDKPVLVGNKYYSNKDSAYSAAKKLWRELKQNEEENSLPVRFAHLQ